MLQRVTSREATKLRGAASLSSIQKESRNLPFYSAEDENTSLASKTDFLTLAIFADQDGHRRLGGCRYYHVLRIGNDLLLWHGALFPSISQTVLTRPANRFGRVSRTANVDVLLARLVFSSSANRGGDS